jgi:hypothetical protein
MYAQPQQQAPVQTSIWMGSSPTLGASCVGPEYAGIGAVIFLTSTGSLTTCAAGIWQPWPFGIFLGGQTAVAMTGTDVPLFTASLPPLAPGGCFDISYGVGAGLNGGTLKLQIDGNTISQPFTASSLTQVNINVFGLILCNLPGTQTVQQLTYLGGPAAFISNFWTPNSSWSYPTATPLENDAPVSTPASIDWSKGHTFTLTAAQSSGSVTPQYLRIKGGF